MSALLFLCGYDKGGYLALNGSYQAAEGGKPPAEKLQIGQRFVKLDKMGKSGKTGISERQIKQACLVLINSGTPRAVVELAERQKVDPKALLAAAKARLSDLVSHDLVEQRNLAVTRLNTIYERADAAGELNTALAAQRELNKLLGLYDITVEVDSPVSRPDEGRRYLEALLRGRVSETVLRRASLVQLARMVQTYYADKAGL